MGFTIKEDESMIEIKGAANKSAAIKSKSDEKEFYSFLQKLNLRTEMGME